MYEFFTGGGCPPGELPRGLATEAFGMLWALLADFRRWGVVRTITALDARFEQCIPGLDRRTLPADEIVCALPGEHEDVYLSLLKRCDAVLLIAPETNDILAALTLHAESAGIPVLGSGASAAATAGDKEVCARLFRQANLPIPETRAASFASATQVVKQMGCPLVIKPVDGIGSEGVCRVERLTDLPAILETVRKVTTHDRVLIQSLAGGVAVSASLLVAEGRCLALSLNRQLMGTGFQYRGSHVPMQHPESAGAMKLACSGASLIPGLRGYVGIDMVLSEDAVLLIEINPRITTSYIALRQVIRLNLAQAIWEACRNGILPECIPLAGHATIIKDTPQTWGLGIDPV